MNHHCLGLPAWVFSSKSSVRDFAVVVVVVVVVTVVVCWRLFSIHFVMHPHRLWFALETPIQSVSLRLCVVSLLLLSTTVKHNQVIWAENSSRSFWICQSWVYCRFIVSLAMSCCRNMLGISRWFQGNEWEDAGGGGGSGEGRGNVSWCWYGSCHACLRMSVCVYNAHVPGC